MIDRAAPRAAHTLPTDPVTASTNSQAEYAALIELVEQFTPDDWHRPTDCEGWTPREIVAHLAGAAESAVRWRKFIKHNAIATARAARGPLQHVDYMCASQIAERQRLNTAQLVADLRNWATQAPQKLRTKPAFVRSLQMPASAGLPQGATMATLFDVINTRDVWLHRIDLARATGRTRSITLAESEVVSQVLRDLDNQWTHEAVELTLTGPGGGSWQIGEGDPVASVTEEAVAYLRLLSGRSDECVLSAAGDVRMAQTLRQQRIVF